MAGRRDDARAILTDLAATDRPPAFDLGILCLFLGQLNEGLAWLERALQERESKLCILRALLKRNDFLRPYEAEPSMQALLARIVPRGLPSNSALTATPHFVKTER